MGDDQQLPAQQAFTVPSSWCVISVSDAHDHITNFEKLKTSEYLEKGSVPVIDQGAEFIGGYSNLKSLTIMISTPHVIFGDHTLNLKYVDFPFIAGADGIKILSTRQF